MQADLAQFQNPMPFCLRPGLLRQGGWNVCCLWALMFPTKPLHPHTPPVTLQSQPSTFFPIAVATVEVPQWPQQANATMGRLDHSALACLMDLCGSSFIHLWPSCFLTCFTFPARTEAFPLRNDPSHLEWMSATTRLPPAPKRKNDEAWKTAWSELVLGSFAWAVCLSWHVRHFLGVTC